MLDLFTGVASELVRPLHTTRGLAMSTASTIGLSLVIAGSFVRTMVPLRTLTLLSNIFLLLAATLAPNLASILIYCILIPLNSWRLVEIHRLTRKVAAAAQDGDLSGIWLKPYMRASTLPAGTVLFRRGDAAEALYLVLEGELELVEIGQRQPPRQLFGEISFFAPERARTLTARCVTECTVLSIGEDAFRRLYFQTPKLAFQISNLIAQRLGADVRRAQASNAQLQQRCAELELELQSLRKRVA